MRLYVHMMLCGSIFTLAYIVFNRILPYELTLKWRQRLIRINTALYLLPVPWLAAEGKELVCWLLEKTGVVFSKKKTGDVFDAASVWGSFIVLDEDGKIVRITGYQGLLPVLLLVLVVCCTLLAGWLLLYMQASRRYRRSMVLLDAEQYERKKNTGRKIMVGVSPCVPSPVTVGLAKPVILFPVDYHQYEGSMEAIFLHEQNHVLCADIVARFFCFAVLVVYFWNPLACFLFRENVAVSEMLGDEVAVSGRTRRQKADYIRCIMEASQRTETRKTMVLSLGKSKSLLRKRMERIMETNKRRVWKKRTVVVIVAVCALAGSIPALAYQKPRNYVQSGMDDWSEKDVLVFSQTGEENPMEGKCMDFRYGDAVFVGGDGNTDYSINDYQAGQQQNVCAHSYTSGTIAEHERHADGSCTVVTYEAQKCAKCGSAVRGDEIAAFTYKSCPHTNSGGTEPDNYVSDETNTPASEKAVVNVNALRVRSAADPDAAVSGLLKKGEIVEIIAQEGDFYKVIIKQEDEEPMEGYVRMEYLER